MTKFCPISNESFEYYIQMTFLILVNLETALIKYKGDGAKITIIRKGSTINRVVYAPSTLYSYFNHFLKIQLAKEFLYFVLNY